ncbi:uncharacterized protein EI90DRAFT_3061083, partial [Cantharellus anzutake]|uniref:uncharacterized protein n=1 Tax=Cantharellus anzutake TaxID=1750568 RepID=UPI001903EE4F
MMNVHQSPLPLPFQVPKRVRVEAVLNSFKANDIASGFHFSASSMTHKEVKFLSVQQTAKKFSHKAPTLWHFIGCLLLATFTPGEIVELDKWEDIDDLENENNDDNDCWLLDSSGLPPLSQRSRSHSEKRQ